MTYFKKDYKRASIVLYYDIESQTYLSIHNDCINFNLPGGKCFMNESYEDCAIRELNEETNLIVKKENLKLILKEKCGIYEVATFLMTECTGILSPEEGYRLNYVPLNYMLLNNNKEWVLYHKKILNYIKQNN